MSFEEEFDRIIQQKTGEADFPFDENNWEKARKMLDSERKSGIIASSAKFYVIAILLLCIVSAGYFIYNDFNDQASLQASATTKENKVAESQPAVDQTLQNELAENKSVDDQGTNNVENQPTQVTETPENNSISEPITTKAETPLANTSAVQKTDSEKAVKIPAKKVEAPLLSSTPNNQIAKNAPARQTTGTPVPEIHEPAVNEPATSESRPETALVSTKNNTANERIVAANEKTGLDNETKEPAAQTIITEEGGLPYEAISTFIPKQEKGAEPEIIPAPINVLNYFDEDYYTKEKYKNHYLNVEAGGNYLLGWQVKDKRDGQGLNWFAGLNYGFYVTKKVSLSVGLQGYNIANINNAFFDHSKTEYGFSSTSTRTMITSNALYYAAIPLKIAYDLNAQNQIGMGCNVGLLMSSQNIVETWYYQADVNSMKTSSKTNGYYEGMNTTNILLSVFYKTKFGKRLSLNGEVTYAPNDIYKYVNSKVNTANTLGVRLSLQYTLFEK